jgi:hypothetical protein
MAYASITYTSASGTTFALTNSSGDPIPYLRQSDISVTVNGVLKTLTTDYTFNTAGTSIVLNTSVSGASVVIARVTDIADATVTYTAGSTLTAQDLNNADNQIRYGLQEFSDTYGALTTGTGDLSALAGFIGSSETWTSDNAHTATTGAIDNRVDSKITTNNATVVLRDGSQAMQAALSLGGFKVTNLATPTSNTDASTKAYVDTNVGSVSASATAAAASASAAATSASNASTSASAASASQSAAASSASSASTSASNASTSASSASTSASNASTSATNAATSATSAASSAASALAAFDSFDDRYLGSKASDPTVDNDGDPLNAGDIYFNTTLSIMRVYTGTAWVAAYVPGDAVNISFTPYSTIAATNVQNAVQELTDEKLNLTGGTLTGALVNPLGSAAAPSLTFTGDVNTGIYSPGADQVAISTAGSGRLFVDASGNVGINTASNLTKLSVAGVESAQVSRVNISTLDNQNRRLTISQDTILCEAPAGFGTASNQKIEFNPAAGYLNFYTANTERLRITSAGRLGVGTSSPTETLTVNGSIDLPTVNTWIKGGGHNVLQVDATRTYFYGGTNGVQLRTANNASELINITNAGLVGIGTSSPSGPLDVVTGSEGAIFRFSAASTNLQILPEAANGNVAVRMRANSGAAPNFQLRNDAGSNLVTITNGGSVGIGTTSPGAIFQTRVAADKNIAFNLDSNSEARISSFNDAISASAPLGFNGTDLRFQTGNTERARIDSSGRLLVGTSSSRGNWFNTTFADPLVQLEGSSSTRLSITRNDNSDNSGELMLGNSRSSAYAVLSNNDNLGRISFQGADGSEMVAGAYIQCFVDGTPGANDMPGRLVFSTTADGASSPTDRMRINQTGGTYVVSTDSVVIALSSTQAAGTTYYLIDGKYSGTAGIVASGTRSFRVFTNGNVENTNNSYGALSDLKLKENIVDANSQWDDLKALQVRNYNFKEGQTHTQIGLVAQEVELVSPGLVSESPDRDDEGNDLGTVTKSVNYSVLYMKAVKALQEAIAKIETLEGMVAVNNITIDEQQHQLSTLAARLTALESA